MKPSDDFSLYQKIWDFTREQLSVKYPFFRKLLWNFSFEESEDTKSAGTDGKIIYFNPDFLLKSFQESSTKLEELFLHMLYHCLFLHLIMDVPPDCRLWDLACDAAVQRILQNEKKERDPMKIYQEFQNSALSPDSPELSAKDEAINSPDDHTFWKYTDRQKFLETIQQTLGGMSAAAGMGLYGNSGRGSAPGNQVEELSVEEKGKYDFHHFLRRFAVHREEIHTDTQSFDYIPYIYGLDHYGNIPLIEYLEYQEVTRLEELVIAIDTSGSCSADTVRCLRAKKCLCRLWSKAAFLRFKESEKESGIFPLCQLQRRQKKLLYPFYQRCCTRNHCQRNHIGACRFCPLL